MTTYTFIWPAHGENPLGLWLQKWSGVAEDLEQAWDACMKATINQDWAPMVGDSIAAITGEHHQLDFYRAIPIAVPLGLTGVHALGPYSEKLDRIGMKMRQEADEKQKLSTLAGTTGLEKMARALENNIIDGYLLCRRCDIFVGFAATGRVVPPEIDLTGKNRTTWLEDHCWMCHRSRDEIIEAYMQAMEGEK